jgi:hypothetical protein
MDQHFSNIINTFKRLDESTKKNSHGHSKKQQAAIAIAKQGMAEGDMDAAEHHAHGPKFTGYWAGTDSGTPGNKMVGGSAEESIEEAIAREWKAYVQEAGASNPAQGGQQLNPQQQQAQQLKLTNVFTKLRAASGKELPGGPAAVAKGATEILNNPNPKPNDPNAGSPLVKKAKGALSDEILSAMLDPPAAQQITTAVKNATQNLIRARGAA